MVSLEGVIWDWLITDKDGDFENCECLLTRLCFGKQESLD